MSALCGLLRFDGSPVSAATLERQLNTLKRREPDRQAVWCDGVIGLGHALMRVTQEDLFDKQPLQDAGRGVILAADVRLDNREELATALGIAAEQLRDLPDSALILAAYKMWGEKCAEHLLGDFVFALWDARARKLVLARDHMGGRYLFFFHGPEFFAFASEKKALWPIEGVPCRLDELAIGLRLTLDLRDDKARTIHQDIWGLPGGTVMTVQSDGQAQSRRYWRPHADPQHLGHSEDYYVATYRRLLGEAVACRLRRNIHPSGLFLSGGFDSAAIAALAGPVVTARRQKLIAAASVMPEAYRGPLPNARERVEDCARHMPHLDLRYVTREGFGLFDKLEDDFLSRDDAVSPNRVANSALHTALAKAGVRVMMDGHGGDYTLNPTAKGWLAEQLVKGRWRLFLRECHAYRVTRATGYWSILKTEILRPLLPRWFWRWRERYREGAAQNLPPTPLSRAFAMRIRSCGGALELTAPKTPRTDRWAGMQALLYYLQDIAQSPGHFAAAKFGLEYTQPFHDKRIVEFALAIPPKLFVRNGFDRHLARQALGDILPPEFRTQQKAPDALTPDFSAVVEQARPQLLTDIARLEKKERLTRLFDFDRMQQILSAPGRGGEQQMRQALRVLFMARFIEWHERSNEP